MKRALFLGLVAAFLVGCAREQKVDTTQRPVAVAAASDLRYAMESLLQEFHRRHPDIQVDVTFGSSGNFFAQLKNKAPFDMYFSADRAYPAQLVKEGLAKPESEFCYAIGKIVLWVLKESALDIEKLGIQAVLDPSVRKISIANPQHAPYGRAAQSALEHHDLWEKVQEKIVLGENITQAAQFVESGAADIGIIALSLAMAPALVEKGRYVVIPPDSYPAMEQGSVIMNWARDPGAAETLREFIISPEGQDILRRYGFEVPAA